MLLSPRQIRASNESCWLLFRRCDLGSQLGAGSRDAFLLDVPRNRQLADKYWNEEVKGSNAFTQRTLRTTVNRVAHYKSGAELAAEVAAAKK